MPEVPEEPSLIAEVPRQEARATRLSRLQQEITRRPGLFLMAFESLGEQATQDSLDLDDERINTVDLSTEPHDLIKEYFTKRDDKVVTFDEATDDALYADKKFDRLRKYSASLTNERVKTGAMRTGVRVNPNAAPAVNEVRRYAFGFFLKRAVAWSQQRSAGAEDSLPSAG
jgi:hypothetical protein